MNNKIIAAILLSAFVSTSVFAKGGGVGNSGYGLQCGAEPLRMIESVKASRIGETLLDIIPAISRKQLNKLVVERLSQFDSRLASEIEIQLSKQRESERWESISEPESMDHYLTQRDIDGCSPVQVAVFREGESQSIESGYSRLTSDLERGVLELHEAFYQIGVRSYGHLNPVKTQELLSLLLVKDNETEFLKSEIRQSIRIYIGQQKYAFGEEYNGLYMASKSLKVELKGCPHALVLHPTGYGTQVFLLRNQEVGKVRTSYMDRFAYLADDGVRVEGKTLQFHTSEAPAILTYEGCTFVRIPGESKDYIRELKRIEAEY